MRESIPNRYVTFILLLALATILTGIFLTEIMLFIIMPVFFMLEIYMLIRYPKYVRENISADNLTALLMWNTRIHLVHFAFGLAVCIPLGIIFPYIEDTRDILRLCVTLTPCFVGSTLSRIIAFKSCRPILRFSTQNQLCTPKAADIFQFLYALPLVCLISATVMDIRLTRKLSDF